MTDEDIRKLVWDTVSEAARKGPGWAQEGVVLRQVRERITGGGMEMVAPELKLQQTILDAWHDLFTQKQLGWGYDLDNPNSPFFHIRKADTAQER